MLRYLFTVLAALLLPVLGSAQGLTTLVPDPPFAPPPPYPPDAHKGMFWYGTDALWTERNVEGKWSMSNGQGYSTKLIFWRRGFDWRKEPEPQLIITGRHLDGDAPAIAVAHANAVCIPSRDAAGRMTLIDIPTAGCWELTGRYDGHTLTFLVSVEP